MPRETGQGATSSPSQDPRPPWETVDRKGNAEALKLPLRPYLHPRISPDMRQLAVEIEGPNHNFYIYDFAREALTQMTTDGASHSPDHEAGGRREPG